VWRLGQDWDTNTPPHYDHVHRHIVTSGRMCALKSCRHRQESSILVTLWKTQMNWPYCNETYCSIVMTPAVLLLKTPISKICLSRPFHIYVLKEQLSPKLQIQLVTMATTTIKDITLEGPEHYHWWFSNIKGSVYQRYLTEKVKLKNKLLNTVPEQKRVLLPVEAMDFKRASRHQAIRRPHERSHKS
jgi:hypothetical protein